MIKVFLDTNILLDFVTQRDGFDNACAILQLSEDNKIHLFTSFLTMANTAYVGRKGRTAEELYGVLEGLSEMIDILPMDKVQFQEALKIRASDIEDVLQFICAKKGNCDVIITRNKKHFPFSDIPVYTPSEFLSIHF